MRTDSRQVPEKRTVSPGPGPVQRMTQTLATFAVHTQDARAAASARRRALLAGDSTGGCDRTGQRERRGSTKPRRRRAGGAK